MLHISCVHTVFTKWREARSKKSPGKVNSILDMFDLVSVTLPTAWQVPSGQTPGKSSSYSLFPGPCSDILHLNMSNKQKLSENWCRLCTVNFRGTTLFHFISFTGQEHEDHNRKKKFYQTGWQIWTGFNQWTVRPSVWKSTWKGFSVIRMP